MVQVLINRPNRTRIRYFRACDAARIAREVVKDDPETTPEEVLACIAKGMGFTHISLSRQRTADASVSLRKDTIISILKLAKKGLEIATQKFSFLRRYIIPILQGINDLIQLVDSLRLFDPDSSPVEEVINKDKCKCKDEPKDTSHKKVGKK